MGALDLRAPSSSISEICPCSQIFGIINPKSKPLAVSFPRPPRSPSSTSPAPTSLLSAIPASSPLSASSTDRCRRDPPPPHLFPPQAPPLFPIPQPHLRSPSDLGPMLLRFRSPLPLPSSSRPRALNPAGHLLRLRASGINLASSPPVLPTSASRSLCHPKAPLSVPLTCGPDPAELIPRLPPPLLLVVKML